MKHTPGPWRTTPQCSSIYAGDAFENESVMIATLQQEEFHRDGQRCYPAPTKEEMQANAHLIAAAPDLLTACQSAAQYLQWRFPDDPPHVLDELNLVIAKAEGRQP